MADCNKDFISWAKVAYTIESRERNAFCKVGAIYWVSAGVNIGSEIDGKGPHFTRPALVLKKFGDRLALVVFTTTRRKRGRLYRPIMVSGAKSWVILDQLRTVDLLRVGSFIDELPPSELIKIKSTLADLIR